MGSAFQNCLQLESINIPDHLVFIGYRAFLVVKILVAYLFLIVLKESDNMNLTNATP
jgi:hypothetical protein